MAQRVFPKLYDGNAEERAICVEEFKAWIAEEEALFEKEYANVRKQLAELPSWRREPIDRNYRIKISWVRENAGDHYRQAVHYVDQTYRHLELPLEKCQELLDKALFHMFYRDEQLAAISYELARIEYR